VLAGLGPRRAETLAKRGIRTVEDLLYRLPAGYDDRRTLASVGSLAVGARATFAARVLGCGFGGWRGRGGRGGRMFEAVVGDESGTVELKWFRGGEALERSVRKGALLLVTGDVKRYRFAKEIQHPEVEVLAEPGATRRRRPSCRSGSFRAMRHPKGSTRARCAVRSRRRSPSTPTS
jgi:ATP-dependent DNA helicase RecG